MADADVALAAHGVAELAEAPVLLGHHELRWDVGHGAYSSRYRFKRGDLSDSAGVAGGG